MEAVVAALGAGAGVAGLASGLAPSALSVAAVKGLAAGAFGVNVFAVQLPGRLDGELAKAMKDQGDEAKGGEVSDAVGALLPSRGRSFITPAGWAFAIWGPIYAGELAFSAWVALSGLGGPAGGAVREALPHWVSANLFQGLWCATFRPRFHAGPAKRALGPFVSPLYLGLTALSLGRAHAAVARSPGLTSLEGVAFLPLTMHFGWTTAATLVNINGAVASYRAAGSDRNLYALACASIASALGAGALVAAGTKSPTYPLVLGWALFAVASGMGKRVEHLSEGPELAHAQSVRSMSYAAGVAAVLMGAATMVAARFR